MEQELTKTQRVTDYSYKADYALREQLIREFVDKYNHYKNFYIILHSGELFEYDSFDADLVTKLEFEEIENYSFVKEQSFSDFTCITEQHFFSLPEINELLYGSYNLNIIKSTCKNTISECLNQLIYPDVVFTCFMTKILLLIGDNGEVFDGIEIENIEDIEFEFKKLNETINALMSVTPKNKTSGVTSLFYSFNVSIKTPNLLPN